MLPHLLGFLAAIIAACAKNAVAQTPAPDLARSPAPAAATLNPALPTLFVAGDSTAARGRGATQQGWGVPFADYFDPAKINVVNRARGGRSSRTFITDGLWGQLLADAKAGDTVLIQFGHNDGGALNDEPPPPLRARGSIPGLGEQTREIDNVLTKKHEVVHSFGWYLRRMIADVKAKGADLHAAMVVAGLKGLRPSPVANALSAKGQAVVADKFAWLRLPSAANPKLPSVFLVGDSTVRTGRGDGGGGQWGWGEYLPAHLDLEKVNVVNRAVGGTGVRSFLDTGYWDLVTEKLKPGDVVLIQFGHNDNGVRAPLKGIGGEVEERENPTTKEKAPMRTWGWYLRRYIREARAKGATPVVCSLIPRKIWKDGKIVRTSDSHADWARDVAKAEGVAFVDLHELIARRYDELGSEKVNPFFADERVHTSAAGAEFNAARVVEGLKALPQNPVAAYLRATPTMP